MFNKLRPALHKATCITMLISGIVLVMCVLGLIWNFGNDGELLIKIISSCVLIFLASLVGWDVTDV